MPPNQTEKYERFKALHQRKGAFVIPNPWNAGTARILSEMGFEALATTSAGLAFDIGKRDSAGGLNRQEVLDNCRNIVDATNLPVSGDLEDCFGSAPEICAETIKMACKIGLVGGSIEDATGNAEDPIYEFDLAVERVVAACEAARDLPFLLTARAENYLHGVFDLNETIRRLQAFSSAGADVLYAPGLPDLAAIRQVCEAVDKPVNVVMGLQGTAYTVSQLQEAGVKRISVGGSFARAALGEFFRAAREVLDEGTFEYSDRCIPDREVGKMMSASKRTDPEVL